MGIIKNVKRGQMALSTGGLSEVPGYLDRREAKNAPPPPDRLEADRLERLLSNKDDLQYIDQADRDKYKSALDQFSSIAPQDRLGFAKSNADALEALIATRKERSNIFKEQLKLMAETPGSKQFKNQETPLILAGKSSLLGGGSTGAQAAASQGTVLTR